MRVVSIVTALSIVFLLLSSILYFVECVSDCILKRVLILRKMCKGLPGKPYTEELNTNYLRFLLFILNNKCKSIFCISPALFAGKVCHLKFS